MDKKELTMKEIQDVSIEILKKVADICEEQNLKYYLAYGTLIGAIRHKGYIPWDDDVDIWMPREDYEKLVEYFRENYYEMMPYKMMNNEISENYPYILPRVIDSRYMLDVKNEKKCGMGIFIDIFPLDGLGDDKNHALKLIDCGKNLSSLIFLSTRKHFGKGTTKSIWKLILKFPIYLYAKLKGKNYFAKKSMQLSLENKYCESKYVGCVTWPTYRDRDVFDKELFDKTILVDFGKYEFRVPEEYDRVLSQIYGDYMKLPSQNERKPHHLYKAYEV